NWAGGNLTAASGTDNFNRADGPLGSNWTRSPGNTESGAIRSNTVGMEDSSATRRADWYNATSFSSDQYSQVYLSVLPATTGGATVRMQSGADSYYGAGFDNNNNNNSNGTYLCRIWVYINGIPTSLAVDSTCHIAAGDTLRLEAQGSTLRFYQNSVLKLTATSTLLTGGSPGFEFIHNVNGSPVLDNWAGGNMTAASGTDNFNRADGPLGSNWTRSPGNTEYGSIRSNTVGMEDSSATRRADSY